MMKKTVLRAHSTNLRIGCVEQFIEIVRNTRDEWGQSDRDKFWKLWFRGHCCESWELKPQLYRRDGATLRQAISDEEEFRLAFERRGLQLIAGEKAPTKDIEWYFLMQHYGAPTRLLDWTDGALMGLYFAVLPPSKSSPDKKRDAAVWLLDPEWLNGQTTRKKDGIDGVVLPDWEIVEKYLPEKFEGRRPSREYPIAIDPSHVARRLAVQRSRFTIHGSRFNGLEEIAASKSKARLRKIVIERKAVRPIRKDLETCGISNTTLFPDLQGLGRELRLLWRFKKEPEKDEVA